MRGERSPAAVEDNGRIVIGDAESLIHTIR
jgi:hypothetical protein